MTAEVFLDTGYVIALAAPTDQLHATARALADQMAKDGTRIVTTRAVLLEIGNALAKQRYRPAAVQILTSLESDPRVTIVGLSDALFTQGFEMFCNRKDKEWGLIDCISFVVMTERGISDALAFDEHFEQAGFRSLLRGKPS